MNLVVPVIPIFFFVVLVVPIRPVIIIHFLLILDLIGFHSLDGSILNDNLIENLDTI